MGGKGNKKKKGGAAAAGTVDPRAPKGAPQKRNNRKEAFELPGEDPSPQDGPYQNGVPADSEADNVEASPSTQENSPSDAEATTTTTPPEPADTPQDNPDPSNEEAVNPSESASNDLICDKTDITEAENTLNDTVPEATTTTLGTDEIPLSESPASVEQDSNVDGPQEEENATPAKSESDNDQSETPDAVTTEEANPNTQISPEVETIEGETEARMEAILEEEPEQKTPTETEDQVDDSAENEDSREATEKLADNVEEKLDDLASLEASENPSEDAKEKVEDLKEISLTEDAKLSSIEPETAGHPLETTEQENTPAEADSHENDTLDGGTSENTADKAKDPETVESNETVNADEDMDMATTNDECPATEAQSKNEIVNPDSEQESSPDPSVQNPEAAGGAFAALLIEIEDCPAEKNTDDSEDKANTEDTKLEDGDSPAENEKDAADNETSPTSEPEPTLNDGELADVEPASAIVNLTPSETGDDYNEDFDGVPDSWETSAMVNGNGLLDSLVEPEALAECENMPLAADTPSCEDSQTTPTLEAPEEVLMAQNTSISDEPIPEIETPKEGVSPNVDSEPESAKSTETKTEAAQAESLEPSEPAKPTILEESAMPTEVHEPSEPDELAEINEAIEPTQSNEATEPSEADKATEPAESSPALETAEPAEPTESKPEKFDTFESDPAEAKQDDPEIPTPINDEPESTILSPPDESPDANSAMPLEPEALGRAVDEANENLVEETASAEPLTDELNEQDDGTPTPGEENDIAAKDEVSEELTTVEIVDEAEPAAIIGTEPAGIDNAVLPGQEQEDAKVAVVDANTENTEIHQEEPSVPEPVQDEGAETTQEKLPPSDEPEINIASASNTENIDTYDGKEATSLSEEPQAEFIAETPTPEQLEPEPSTDESKETPGEAPEEAPAAAAQDDIPILLEPVKEEPAESPVPEISTNEAPTVIEDTIAPTQVLEVGISEEPISHEAIIDDPLNADEPPSPILERRRTKRRFSKTSKASSKSEDLPQRKVVGVSDVALFIVKPGGGRKSPDSPTEKVHNRTDSGYGRSFDRELVRREARLREKEEEERKKRRSKRSSTLPDEGDAIPSALEDFAKGEGSSSRRRSSFMEKPQMERVETNRSGKSEKLRSQEKVSWPASSGAPSSSKMDRDPPRSPKKSSSSRRIDTRSRTEEEDEEDRRLRRALRKAREGAEEALRIQSEQKAREEEEEARRQRRLAKKARDALAAEELLAQENAARIRKELKERAEADEARRARRQKRKEEEALRMKAEAKTARVPAKSSEDRARRERKEPSRRTSGTSREINPGEKEKPKEKDITRPKTARSGSSKQKDDRTDDKAPKRGILSRFMSKIGV
ncbi:MAG: hypothetical protein M1829_002249 [Trizodia sp. TS-e1964]|nr:MAG: hypothetical protein M1829_002249 [Trizodia sp. TS-e1964]